MRPPGSATRSVSCGGPAPTYAVPAGCSAWILRAHWHGAITALHRGSPGAVSAIAAKPGSTGGSPTLTLARTHASCMAGAADASSCSTTDSRRSRAAWTGLPLLRSPGDAGRGRIVVDRARESSHDVRCSRLGPHRRSRRVHLRPRGDVGRSERSDARQHLGRLGSEPVMRPSTSAAAWETRCACWPTSSGRTAAPSTRDQRGDGGGGSRSDRAQPRRGVRGRRRPRHAVRRQRIRSSAHRARAAAHGRPGDRRGRAREGRQPRRPDRRDGAGLGHHRPQWGRSRNHEGDRSLLR